MTTIRNIERAKSLAAYAVAAAAALSIYLASVGVAGFNLRIPIHYIGGDSMAVFAGTKSLAEGAALHNPKLGAPGSADFAALPQTDSLNMAALWLAAKLTGGWAAAVNLYYLATYPLAAIVALAVLRRWGVSRLVATAAAVLFALQPYHFYRNETHLFLSAYFLVPLAILLADHIAIGGAGTARNRYVLLIVATAAVASCGIYNAFFAGFFMLVAIGLGLVTQRNWRPLRWGATAIAVLLLAVLINTIPAMAYRSQQGPGSAALVRNAAGADAFSLKLTYLLFPALNHRLPLFNSIIHAYDATMPVSESSMAAVGLLAAAGIVTLLAIALLHCVGGTTSPRLGRLAAFCAAGILLGTTGSFGSLFAWFISPMIRAYDRVSIFLAFFALAAIALLVDPLLTRLRMRRHGTLLAMLAVVAVGALAALDQIPRAGPDLARSDREFRSDDRFVQRIEASVPPASLIFQLPYMPFPEAVPPAAMHDYDLFRGYLHSRRLRWCYGAMRGSATDRQLAAIAALPPPQMIVELKKLGFSGIYLDRTGFTSNDLENELIRLCGHGEFASDDGTLAFVPLKSAG